MDELSKLPEAVRRHVEAFLRQPAAGAIGKGGEVEVIDIPQVEIEATAPGAPQPVPPQQPPGAAPRKHGRDRDLKDLRERLRDIQQWLDHLDSNEPEK